MKDTSFIKLIFLSLLAIGLSVEFTRQSFFWLTQYRITADAPGFQVSGAQIVKLFMMSLVYFSALLILPLFVVRIIEKFKLLPGQFVFIMLGLEGLLLLYSIGFSPDILSAVVVFLMCQPIAIVNGIVLYRNFRRRS